MADDCYTEKEIQGSEDIGTILTGPRCTSGEREYSVAVGRIWERQDEAALVSG